MLFIFFAVYLLIVGNWVSAVLVRVFGLDNNFNGRILGVFASFLSLGWVAGVAILFLPLTFWVLAGIFVLNALIFFLLSRWAKRIIASTVIPSDPALREERGTRDLSDTELEDRKILHFIQNDKLKVRFASVAFLILVCYGFYLLYSSRTGNAILTPWQVINPQYIFIFFLSTLTLGVLIWSKLKTPIIILFLILQTFLLHSYLPLTHDLIYGADGWRHIANEQRLLDGKQFLEAKIVGPIIYDNPNSEILNLKSVVGQLSYGNFWSSNVILAKVFKTDLLTITKWFLPILWSLVFPLLLFEIGCAFGCDNRRSLFLAWLGLLPFAWQAGGAFTLPVSFGFLIWLFLILLILKRINSPKKEQVWVLAGAGIGLASGYILYFILFWLAWFVSEVLQFKFIKLKVFFLTIVSLLSIPALELLAGYSHFDKNINWLGQIKQVLGNFFGIYLASGPRPHDIAFGNIIFNQTPLVAFVPNLLTQWRWWIVVFTICFFGIAVYGWVRAWKTKTTAGQWLAVMSVGVVDGYIIANYFLAGSHILARRLDAVVALFLILLFFYGLEKFILNNYKKTILAVFILTIGITASYSLGPDTNTVSANEYQASKYIWNQERSENRPCVLGDTFPLLALEAISAKEIIGGGFPIDANFAQLERVELFSQMNVGINDHLLSDLTNLRGVNHCWFMGSTDNFAKQGILNTGNFKVFGDTSVVRYNINNY